MTDQLDILVRLLLDKAKQQQLDRGIKTIEKDLKGVDKSSAKLAETLEEKTNKQMLVLAARAQAADSRLRSLKENAQQLGNISQTMLLAGAAVVTGIFVAANAEAQRIREAGGIVDETTQRWLDANARIQASYQRIGGVALEAALPMLERAAELAERGAAFVEAHPDLVKAALNIGLVVASIGAIGSLVAKGIRLYADIKLLASSATQLVAARAMQDAANKMLTAAVGSQRAAVGNQSAASGMGLVAARLIGGIALYATAIYAANEAFRRLGITQKVEDAQRRVISEGGQIYPGAIINQDLKDDYLASRRSHDYTGYAYSGMHAMAKDGQREFVLDGAATRAAERRLGSQLNEQALLSAIGGGQGVTWNDHRVFSSSLSPQDLEVIKRETAGMIDFALDQGGPNG